MRLFDVLYFWWWSNHPSKDEKAIIDRLELHPFIFFMCKKKRRDIRRNAPWYIMKEN